MKAIKTKKVVWVTPSTDVYQTKFRRRVMYIANALNSEFKIESIITKDKSTVINLLEENCHLIFVDTWKPKDIELAYKAKTKNCSVYLDCSEQIIPGVNEDSLSNHDINHFNDSFDKFIVSNAVVADSINESIRSKKNKDNHGSIAIIPNISENKSELVFAVDFMKENNGAEAANKLSILRSQLLQLDRLHKNSKKLLWFSDSYSSKTNTGISQLIPYLEKLKKLQMIYNYELIICSNNEFDKSILDYYAIHFKQVEYSLVAVYRELLTAQACLVTSDSSSQRESHLLEDIRLSLANRCPVIGVGIHKSEELKGIIQTSLKGGILRYFGSDKSEELRNEDINKSNNLLKRFSAQTISSIYNLLFYNQEISKLTTTKRLEYLEDKKSLTTSKTIAGDQHPFPENIPGPTRPISIDSENIELLLVCGIGDKNWILDGIAKEIGSRSKLRWAIYYAPKNPEYLPKSENVFFLHQTILKKFMQKNLINDGRGIYCWYTHPREENENIIQQQKQCFEKCDKVIFACTMHRDLWTNRGLSEELSCVVLGGFDESIFKYQKKNKAQSIGICSSFYERKNPYLIHKIVENMRDKHFILIGKGWEKYSLYEEMLGLGNISYHTISYEQYYYYYSKMAVFLSASQIEGGPIPLIEAMASNCIPVVSKTGFAPDLINDGENGFIFPTNAKVETVCQLLRKALNMTDKNISASVDQYSWNAFSKTICDLIAKHSANSGK